MLGGAGRRWFLAGAAGCVRRRRLSARAPALLTGFSSDRAVHPNWSVSGRRRRDRRDAIRGDGGGVGTCQTPGPRWPRRRWGILALVTICSRPACRCARPRAGRGRATGGWGSARPAAVAPRAHEPGCRAVVRYIGSECATGRCLAVQRPLTRAVQYTCGGAGRTCATVCRRTTTRCLRSGRPPRATTSRAGPPSRAALV